MSEDGDARQGSPGRLCRLREVDPRIMAYIHGRGRLAVLIMMMIYSSYYKKRTRISNNSEGQ